MELGQVYYNYLNISNSVMSGLNLKYKVAVAGLCEFFGHYSSELANGIIKRFYNRMHRTLLRTRIKGPFHYSLFIHFDFTEKGL